MDANDDLPRVDLSLVGSNELINELFSRTDTARPEEGSTRRIRGLGDVVENITEATGIKAAVEYVNGGPCSGCKKRQEALNRAVPFGKDQK